MVHTAIDNWQNWEQGRYFMAPALYEFVLLKTGQITLATARAGLWITS
jgi:hypothetical protein